MRWQSFAVLSILVALVTSRQGCAAKPAAKIDGEPIPLNSTDPRFSGYLRQVSNMIREKLIYPCLKDVTTGRCEYKAAMLTIQFGLLQDGRVADVAVTKKAEWQVYENAAVTAVRIAAPFPPVPPKLMATAKPESPGIPITANFFYVLNAEKIPEPLR